MAYSIQRIIASAHCKFIYFFTVNYSQLKIQMFLLLITSHLRKKTGKLALLYK